MKKIVASFLFCLFAAIGALTFVGCVASTPIVQYPADTAIAVVYAYDDVANVKTTQVPQAFQTQLDNTLTARNLKVLPVEFSNVQSILESIRDTDRRINALKGFSGNANYLVLTEVSTEFYSALSGRYRWDVHAKMTITDVRTHETLTQSVTLPAVLMYSHENGEDAINAVKAELERRMGTLVDQFLRNLTKGNQTTSTQTAIITPRAQEQVANNAPADGKKKMLRPSTSLL